MSDFFLALTEYFANSLAGELFCESCPTEGDRLFCRREDREADRLFWSRSYLQGESILEICCGGGMATQALLRLGHHPLSMDSDRCDLCLLLKSGLMDPRRVLRPGRQALASTSFQLSRFIPFSDSWLD